MTAHLRHRTALSSRKCVRLGTSKHLRSSLTNFSKSYLERRLYHNPYISKDQWHFEYTCILLPFQEQSLNYITAAADCRLLTVLSTKLKVWLLSQHIPSSIFFLSFDGIHAYLYRLRCSYRGFTTFQQFTTVHAICYQITGLVISIWYNNITVRRLYLPLRRVVADCTS